MMVVLLMGCILSMLGMLIFVFSSLCLHGYVDVMTSGKALEKVIRLGVSTTIGTRSTQQDSFSKSPANYDYIIKHKGLFVSVCDGMGGMQVVKLQASYVPIVYMKAIWEACFLTFSLSCL